MGIHELKLERQKLENKLKDIEAQIRVEEGEPYGVAAIGGNIAYRNTRTVARAVLDLYVMLGETPRAESALERIAERRATEHGLLRRHDE